MSRFHSIVKHILEEHVPVEPLVVNVLPMPLNGLRHVVPKLRVAAKHHAYQPIKCAEECIEERRSVQADRIVLARFLGMLR